MPRVEVHLTLQGPFMDKHTPAPVQVRRTKPMYPEAGHVGGLVARVDGRAVGDAYQYGAPGYSEHQQWARAFLRGVRLAPDVVGVRL